MSATLPNRLVSILRSLGSLIPGPSRSRQVQRVVRPWRDDYARTHPSVGLTPSRLAGLLHTADAGTPQQQFELFTEMLQKWPRLAAVENTRRLALTGLDWELAADDSAADRDLAERAAEVCRETLAGLDGWRDTLNHLATAIGFGLAVAELVWESGRLVDVVPVPHTRLVADGLEPWRLRVRTEDDPSTGVALDEAPLKWIVHRPRAALGRAFDGGLLRASTLLYLAQNLSFKDWLIFSQVAGMPIRVAQFDQGTPDDDKRQLLKMLEALGTDAVAAVGKNIDLRFYDPARSESRPYEPIQDYCNTEVTILWLGQHLTTDMGSSGSRAAAEVHDRVREDLLASDIADEGHTIRRDVLAPIVRHTLGESARPPRFRRSLVQSVDTKVLADTLAVAVNELGMTVPRRWVHQALGIPEALADDEVLGGRTSR